MDECLTERPARRALVRQRRLELGRVDGSMGLEDLTETLTHVGAEGGISVAIR